MEDLLQEKRKRLVAWLESRSSLAVAFSGGVDSTFLAAMAREVLGDRMRAFKATSPIHSRREHRAALKVAADFEIPLEVIQSDEMAVPGFADNPPERCYLCKRYLMAAIIARADAQGFTQVAHGANQDDLDDYRPGFKAARELGIAAPLITAGLSKAEIRSLSREMGLPTWNRPSMACLASRIPYGTPLTAALLEKVEKAESVLNELGFAVCRVRHHGKLARVEIETGKIAALAGKGVRETLVGRLKALGYHHICLDLEGYVQGSLNRDLETPES